MAIDFRMYGMNHVAVVLIPSICHNRLVVYSHNSTNTAGWAIRDFITNRMLDDEHSSRLRADIEAEVDGPMGYFEYPPFYNVDDTGHAERWELYLILRTIARNRRHARSYDKTTVASLPGDTWVPIMPEPPWTPLVL